MYLIVCCIVFIDQPAAPRGGARSKSTAGLADDEHWLRNELHELFTFFSHKCLEALLRATRLSLDLLRKRVFFQRYVRPLKQARPRLCPLACLSIPAQCPPAWSTQRIRLVIPAQFPARLVIPVQVAYQRSGVHNLILTPRPKFSRPSLR